MSQFTHSTLSNTANSIKWLPLLLLFTILAFPGVDATAEEYKAGIGDVLRITIYDNEDLNTVARVSGDGMVSISLIGRVKVLGLTSNQIADKIEKKLSSGYIINPQVTVFVEEYRSKKVSILGTIRNPGLYELSGPTTLLELISTAGGLTDEAGNRATIQKGGKQTKVTTIDLEALLEKGDLTQNVQVNDKDSIFIAKAGTCYVTGEVNQPDSYVIEKDATILKMITKAGGFTGIASKSGVKLIRVINGEKKFVKNVNLDTKVVANDVIVVPESFF